MTKKYEQGPFPGKCTVRGSDYWPDTTLGGRVGGKPPYRGADIVCTAPCNCCKCCCVFFNSLERGETTIAGPSRYVPVRLDGCRSCGQCAAICPMEAIQISDEGARVDAMRCIGCGLCVTKCNFGALKLTTRIPGDTSSNRACDYQKRDHI